jgi:hypothetical protein
VKQFLQTVFYLATGSMFLILGYYYGGAVSEFRYVGF